MSGKCHVSEQPTDFGFEKYWGHLSGATNFFTGDKSFRLNGKEWNVPKMLNGKPFYTTHAITDFALKFLSEEAIDSDSNPFFLYIAYNAPHYPLQAPKKDVEKYKGIYDAGWDVIRKLRYQKQIKSAPIKVVQKLQTPSKSEILKNKRSRSAKLRVIEKISEER